MRSGTLEAHDEFEGVGAHELNPRWDNADGVECDSEIELAADTTPALFAARQELLAPHVRLDGIDVSHYQARVDWARVKAIPTFWGATKVTQSIGYADPTGPGTRQSMANVGLRHRGLYHWVSSVTDPEEQAAWFLKHVGHLSVGEFLMLDAEEAGVDEPTTLALAEALEAAIRRPVAVYSGAYVAGGTIWQSTALREGAYGPRPSALAAYTTEAKALALPGVRAYPWSSWQFSSSGPVDGVWSQTGGSDRVDMNRVDNIAIYDRACGYTASPPVVASSPPPAAVVPPTIPAVPAGPPSTAAILGGDDDMPGFLAKNTDARGQATPAGFALWYVGPFAKRNLTEDDIPHWQRRGLIPSDFALANIDDPRIEWMTTTELDTYPTV